MRLLEWCLRHRRTVVLGWALVGLSAVAILLGRLAWGGALVDNSVGIWFQRDDPALAAYESFNRDFGAEEWSVLLLTTRSIYAPAFLGDLRSLTRAIGRLKHVHKAVSLATVRDSRLDGSGSLVYGAIDPAPDGAVPDAAQIRVFRRRLAANPAFDGALYRAGDVHHAVVLVESDNLVRDPGPYRRRLVDAVRALVARVPGMLSGDLVGTTVINAELNRASQRDVVLFYILVTLFIGATGRLLLGNGRDFSVLMAVVSVSAIVPMALIALSGAAFNMVTVMIPPVLITLSVCDVIHVINAFHAESRGVDPAAAVASAISKIWTPCLWTSVITVAGFLSLVQSTVVPIWQLGVYCGVGIAVAWAITMTLAPVLLVAFWSGPEASVPARRGVGRLSAGVLPLVRGRRAWFWLGLQALLLLSLLGIPRLKVDTNYTKFFGPHTRVTAAYAAVGAAGFGQSPVSVVVRYPRGTPFYARRRLRGLLAFEGALARTPRVIKVLSVTDLLRRLNAAFNGGAAKPLGACSPAKVGQLLFLGELAGNQDIKDFTTDARDRVRIMVLTSYLSSTRLAEFRAAVQRAAKACLPAGARVEVDGTAVLWADMDRQISRTQMASILFIAAVFLVLMPLVFRSLTYGVIGVLVNALPLAMTFGLMGLLGIRLDMATSLIGGVAIGSTVDSTIFFINRFRLAQGAGASWDKAVDEAVLNVGDGVIMTSWILAGGFLCLSASDFLPTAHFGALVTASVLAALYLDIIIDPILLRWAGRLAAPRRAPPKEQP